MFGRYLARKVECDTIEEEARAKNVSLVEIEEERMLRGGRRRRRSKLDKKPEVEKAEKGFLMFFYLWVTANQYKIF
jgi:hypothetical protein